MIILKSSSIKNGAFHRARGVVRGVVTGDEYKLKFVGLITPDIVDIELVYPKICNKDESIEK